MPNTPTPAGDETVLDFVVRELEDVLVAAAPGTRLAAEADLAERLGVSRLTVREGLKVLAGRGLVDLSRGKRPTVRTPDSSVIARDLSFAIRRDARAEHELLAVRRSLEVLSAGEAARNASRAGTAAVEAAISTMEAVAADFDGSPEAVRAYNDADLGFHEALALASGNRMLAHLIEGLSESLRQSFDRSIAGFLAQGRDLREGAREHRAVFECVRRGDAHAAETAMRAHLRATERDLDAAP
ncbi:GntR family transcriptional regulator [Paraoerskovia sediminicola]|uniref:GntR family transcriptional regulator n=1 Tax=Paraoerskovia sediminicola TaxID=1138587 RepID=A0ABN6XAS4_9CELL|nr:FCD domain-containing protein [Paraoerskovia sediminicola]BDZ41944.1 GntR family transcriptional regulator [Paraoerskovia sediminicola]